MAYLIRFKLQGEEFAAGSAADLAARLNGILAGRERTYGTLELLFRTRLGVPAKGGWYRLARLPDYQLYPELIARWSLDWWDTASGLFPELEESTEVAHG